MHMHVHMRPYMYIYLLKYLGSPRTTGNFHQLMPATAVERGVGLHTVASCSVWYPGFGRMEWLSAHSSATQRPAAVNAINSCTRPELGIGGWLRDVMLVSGPIEMTTSEWNYWRNAIHYAAGPGRV